MLNFYPLFVPFSAMSGQIFIGMVTTNFQPKTDILTLIDQLDQACIRFVHFSEDQVLRSKVWLKFYIIKCYLACTRALYKHFQLSGESFILLVVMNVDM